MRDLRIAAALAIAVAATGIGVLVSVAQGGPSSAQEETATKPPVAAFDRPRNEGDALPAAAASEVATSGLPGTDASSSVKAVSDGGWDVYLVPASEGACIALADEQGGASVNCQASDQLASGPPSPGAALTGCIASSATDPPSCSEAILWGIAPDGYTDVTVDVEAGVRPTTSIQSNAYIVKVPLSRSPSRIHFSGSKPGVVRPLGLPGLGY